MSYQTLLMAQHDAVTEWNQNQIESPDISVEERTRVISIANGTTVLVHGNTLALLRAESAMQCGMSAQTSDTWRRKTDQIVEADVLTLSSTFTVSVGRDRTSLVSMQCARSYRVPSQHESPVKAL